MVPTDKAETASSVSGDLFTRAQARGLTDESTRAALKTYVPTGAYDTHIGILGTGSSGRLAVFGVPSMRILKYVGMFSPEPWQGFAYDDESKALLRAGSREDISPNFGDVGRPAVSQTDGKLDGAVLFAGDAANGRVGVLHMDDFEAKQVVANPIFHTAGADVVVTSETEYVLQATEAPELPGGAWVDPDSADLAKALRGGLTFWPYTRGHGAHRGGHLNALAAFTVGLPPYVQGELATGRGPSRNLAFVIGRCKTGDVLLGNAGCEATTPSVLHVVRIKEASEAAKNAARVGGQRFLDVEGAVAAKALMQVDLPAGASAIAISPDGAQALVTSEASTKLVVLDLSALASAAPGAPDGFGVPTLDPSAFTTGTIDLGGSAVDVLYGGPRSAFVSLASPGRLVQVDTSAQKVTASLDLGVPGGRLIVTGADSAAPEGRYVVVLNKASVGRFVPTGPVRPLNPILVEAAADALVPLYDMAVPQATDLGGVLVPASTFETVVRYALGTDTRSGELSPYRTLAGKEHVERKGNRVHVFATVIRSHINPETVEVEEGDVVTFHITNLEQAQDQTHGFTVDTYNVHGSWEPGKVASVTFTADMPGVFPYYCTEFCSALHLEMMGYLMVKPKGYKATAEDTAAAGTVDLVAEKAAYEAKMETIDATQKVIDGVVTWLKEHDYESDPRSAALVQDAVHQLTEAAGIKPKIEASAAAQDWPNARLWAEQYFQYQVKAADAGLRAKKILEEKGAP
ncbi:MAG: cupredoxin domain-containing protein [Deltaproteobacteria bacterium]|nr:cupredoxin domain-containing protein [Deltaproteobacteria bacterium]